MGLKSGRGLESLFENSCDESFDSAAEEAGEKEQEKVEEKDDGKWDWEVGINMGWNGEVGNGEKANIFIINGGLKEELRRWIVGFSL